MLRTKTLSFLSCNASSIKNKLLSLEKIVNDLNLSFFALQETHAKKEGSIKFMNSQNYQIYEQIRTGKSGGGLALGICKSLDPFWIRDGGNEVEAMTIKASFKRLDIRIVNGYGPQEYDCELKKSLFWNYLDNEVLESNMEGSGCIILMDSNSWLGSDVLKNDPHQRNKNGQLFINFLRRNPQMHLLNASNKCEGLITRCRSLENRNELSAIDFVLVCEKVMPYVTKFIIDEQKLYALSNYSKKKISYSDHNSLIGFIELQLKKTKIERKVIFNFKNTESMATFKKKTNDNQGLINTFLDNTPFPKQVQVWWKNVKNLIHKSFKKIRVGKKLPKICQKFKNRKKAIKQNDIDSKIESESQLKQEQHKNGLNRIMKNMSILRKSKNSQQSIWDIKKIFFPKIKPPMPVAKKNLQGKIITNPNELKNVYLEHFKFRMRNRPIIPGLEQYEENVNLKFQQILNRTKNVSIPDWTVHDLDKVLKSLKVSQSPDTMSLVNELFLPKNIGVDLKTSLLIFFNGIKNNCFIPECLKNVFITSIPKKRKSPLDLINERGLFLVPKLRAVLSKLIYNSIIDTIEEQLSPSNIGARKDKSPRDHLFVVYSVINETLRCKDSPCKDFVFTDVSQCFDSLWTQKTLLDLYANGVKSNMLNLIHELSKNARIVIKTPIGNTEQGNIENIIMQGETLSGILCTSTMDKTAKDSKTKSLLYRGEVSVPRLGFVDDILDMNKCGNDIKEMHEETVAELNKRKLQVNRDKSVRMHVAGTKSGKESKCKDLHIDSWSLVTHKSGTNISMKDKYEGKLKVKTVKKYEYLGNIIEEDGSNKETINERVAKGLGVIRDVDQILEGCSFGDYFMEALTIMRDSKLLSVLTYNLEVIPNITAKEIKKLDKVDLQLLRKTMMLSSKSSRSLLLLELGMVPVEYIIKQKRINFLHHLLTSEDQSLAKKIFLKQRENPLKGDFVTIVKSDLKDCRINLTHEEIQNTSKRKFKEIVRESIRGAAFQKLLSEKINLSKGKDLQYEKLKTQSYLMPGRNININDMRRILQLRIRDAPVRENFKSAYRNTNCPSPECRSEESQLHLFNSSCWMENQLSTNSRTKYEDIFGDNLTKQVEVMSVIYNKLATRDKHLRNDGPLDSRGEGCHSRVPDLVIRKAKKKYKSATKRPKVNRNLS